MDVATLFDDVKRMNKRQVCIIFISIRRLTCIHDRCFAVHLSSFKFWYDSFLGINDMERTNGGNR